MMDAKSILARASGNISEAADGWMTPGRIRAFSTGEPGQIWLEKYGSAHGFNPDPISPYDYLNFQFALDREFREKWRQKYARNCPQVCQEAYHVRYAYRLEQTLNLMANPQTQAIYQPALWWAPDSLYGMPDFVVRLSWLKSKFEPAYQKLEQALGTQPVPDDGFVLLEIRYSKSSGVEGKEAYQVLQKQLRLHNYMLAQIQGWAAPLAFLANRSNPGRLIPFKVAVQPGAPLDTELKGFVGAYQEILAHGEALRPWLDAQVGLDLRVDEDEWKSARKRVAWQLTLGGDPIVLHQMKEANKQRLVAADFKTIDDLLKVEPSSLPLEAAGMNPNHARELRALLQANRSNLPVVPGTAPAQKEFEFFVDFEFFSDLGMLGDPFKSGKGEMIFMIGAGKNTPSGWVYKDFIAENMTPAEELRILNAFTEYLRTETGGENLDPAKTAIYHWSPAEINQSHKAGEHHPQGLVPDFNLLPWHDLLATFKQEGCALPGVWEYGLKATAKALGKLDPQYDPLWIGDLDDGSGVIVLGAKAFAKGKEIRQTDEMQILAQYLQADCRALKSVLGWMRSTAGSGTIIGEQGLAYTGWEQVKKPYKESKERTAFARLNGGKGTVVYLHPGSPGGDAKGKPKGIQPLNHLVWGDWLVILDEQAGWYRIYSRNTYGWVHKSWVQDERLLEINFIDVGQGDGCLVVTPDDEKLLIDAGEADNAYRFLRWRFGRFTNPVEFAALVITHPDSDHYAGFGEFFPGNEDAQNIHFDEIYHNGIFEEKSKKIEVQQGNKKVKLSAVADIIQSRADLKEVLRKPADSRYLKLLKAVDESGRVGDINMLHTSEFVTAQAGQPTIDYLEGFEKGKKVAIEVLGPILEGDAGHPYLRWFGNGGKTKNGHSVILRLKYGHARFLLGGDLNEKSEEFLLNHYGVPAEGDARIPPARNHFEAEVAKSCHHGSADTSPAFLQAVNALAAVVSSGDAEPYCHPRPEILGVLGKFGRGEWPLVFSTELARSSRDTIQHPYLLQRELEEARAQKKEGEFIDELMGKLERSVAVYGMITVRSDGEKILLAQKLERPRAADQKWDQHVLEYKNGAWVLVRD